MTDQRTVKLPDAIAAQRALRDSLNLPDEDFPIPEFIGMLSDEIEAARDAGRSDADTAKLISSVSGVTIDANDIAEHYAHFDNRD